jgi:hypothetical protein
MKRLETHPAAIPPHDYGLALKSAVSWLGDRYLLADPLPRRRNERKDYYVETRRWHDVRNTRGPSENAVR